MKNKTPMRTQRAPRYAESSRYHHTFFQVYWFCWTAFRFCSTCAITYTAIIGDAGENFGVYVVAAAFTWLVNLLLLNFAGLYEFEAILRPAAFADKVVLVFVTTFLFLLAAAFSIKISSTFSRVWIASFAVTASLATLGVRLGVGYIVKRLADIRIFTRNAVIVGNGEQAQCLLDHLDKSPSRFSACLACSWSQRQSRLTFRRIPILGELDDVEAYVRGNAIDDVMIALPWSADQKIFRLVSKLRELPVNVYLSTDLIGFRLSFRPPPEHFGELPLVEVAGRPLAGWGAVRKAALDYSLAFILILLLLPVMALIALVIKLDSEGPVFFRQKRYGFINQIFDIYKFRTMRHQPEYAEDNRAGSPQRSQGHACGPVFANHEFLTNCRSYSMCLTARCHWWAPPSRN